MVVMAWCKAGMRLGGTVVSQVRDCCPVATMACAACSRPRQSSARVLASSARRTSRGDLEHGRALIHADDRPRVADLFGELVDIEARPAAHVEDPLPRLGPKGLAHEAPAALHVARRVDRLELGDHLLVEDDLAHRSAQVRAD